MIVLSVKFALLFVVAFLILISAIYLLDKDYYWIHAARRTARINLFDGPGVSPTSPGDGGGRISCLPHRRRPYLLDR